MPCCLQRCTEFNIFANVIIVTNTDSNFALFIKKKKKKTFTRANTDSNFALFIKKKKNFYESKH